MKITKNQLKRIIREELEKMTSAVGHWKHEGDGPLLGYSGVWQQKQLKENGRLPEWYVKLTPIQRAMVFSGAYDVKQYADASFRAEKLPRIWNRSTPIKPEFFEMYGMPEEGPSEAVKTSFSYLLRQDGGIDIESGGAWTPEDTEQAIESGKFLFGKNVDTDSGTDSTSMMQRDKLQHLRNR